MLHGCHCLVCAKEGEKMDLRQKRPLITNLFLYRVCKNKRANQTMLSCLDSKTSAWAGDHTGQEIVGLGFFLPSICSGRSISTIIGMVSGKIWPHSQSYDCHRYSHQSRVRDRYVQHGLIVNKGQKELLAIRHGWSDSTHLPWGSWWPLLYAPAHPVRGQLYHKNEGHWEGHGAHPMQDLLRAMEWENLGGWPFIGALLTGLDAGT